MPHGWWDVASERAGTVRVWRRRTGRLFLLLAAALAVTVLAVIVRFGPARGDVALVAAVAAVVMLPIWAIAARQRLEIDGDRLRVRLLRWHGPIPLGEVVEAHWEVFRGNTRLLLVQPYAGVRVGLWSVVGTVGFVRRGRYRATAGPLRYLALQPWMLTADVLAVLTPPLLRNPDVRMTQRTRRALGG